VIEPGRPPRELSRLDSKNWSATPPDLQRDLAERVGELARRVDFLVLLDQVDIAETGVVTVPVRNAAHAAQVERAKSFFTLADSRRSLRSFPPLGFKMNAAELRRFSHPPAGGATDRAAADPATADITSDDLAAIGQSAASLANETGQPVFVTLAERGIIGATKGRSAEHVPALPLRGPIDVVGAGDAVTATLAASLATRAELREAMELAMAAASLVVHQLGTTGVATVAEMAALLNTR